MRALTLQESGNADDNFDRISKACVQQASEGRTKFDRQLLCRITKQLPEPNFQTQLPVKTHVSYLCQRNNCQEAERKPEFGIPVAVVRDSTKRDKNKEDIEPTNEEKLHRISPGGFAFGFEQSDDAIAHPVNC
jgi:hypothetical protein